MPELTSVIEDSVDGNNVHFNVKIFHPNAQSYCDTSISSMYTRNEQAKKREHGDRIREIEPASFTRLIHSIHYCHHRRYGKRSYHIE